MPCPALAVPYVQPARPSLHLSDSTLLHIQPSVQHAFHQGCSRLARALGLGFGSGRSGIACQGCVYTLPSEKAIGRKADLLTPASLQLMRSSLAVRRLSSPTRAPSRSVPSPARTSPPASSARSSPPLARSSVSVPPGAHAPACARPPPPPPRLKRQRPPWGQRPAAAAPVSAPAASSNGGEYAAGSPFLSTPQALAAAAVRCGSSEFSIVSLNLSPGV